MDIAKYVGLFLIKNEYCYLPGIGNLEIRKKPASYDRENQQMNAPAFDILFRPTIGSIDDTFANFVATNERISIAHAANAIKDFCSRAKADLAEGRDLQVPGVGRFSGSGADLKFYTDPSLQIQPKSIPFFKNSTRSEHSKEKAISEIYQATEFREPKADEEIILQTPQVNWGKIITLSAIVLVLIAGAIFMFYYFNSRNNSSTDPAVADTTVHPETTAPADVVPADTTSQQVPAASVAGTDVTTSYNVVLREYTTSAQAEKRVAQLKSYGNNVTMVAKDSTTFYVVMPVTSPAADTGKVVDSLKRLFNPGGHVSIIK